MSAVQQSQDDLRQLYRDLILDHARKPRHFGRLEDASHQAEGINPLCGDKLKIYFSIDDAGRIDDAMFEGSGCAISVASASLLTDTVIGLTVREAMALFANMVDMLAGRNTNVGVPTTDVELGKLLALQGVREFPSRVKCATLAWHAMKAAIQADSNPATTE